MRLRLCFFSVSALLCATLAVAQGHEPGHDWSYSDALGPTHWGDLKPEFAVCKDGQRQSPIDIRSARSVNLPAIEFHYEPSPLRIIDNGHTIMISYAAGSFIRVGGVRYELKQFHFHRPSEEKIEGHAFDMVAHLVHASADGHLAVVAILLNQGDRNSLVDQLWTDLPKEKGVEEVRTAIKVDLNLLLPANRSYYTFPGSLTTPPCSEDVVWFVLKHPVLISQAEIARFSSLYPNNARPTQALDGREVLVSE
jgi:carbonic anhydrase